MRLKVNESLVKKESDPLTLSISLYLSLLLDTTSAILICAAYKYPDTTPKGHRALPFEYKVRHNFLSILHRPTSQRKEE